MQIQRSVILPSPEQDLRQPREFLARLVMHIDLGFKLLLDAINHKIGFDNFEKYEYTSTDTGTANAEFTVSHNLGFIPARFMVTKISNAGVVYDSGTTWTSTQIFLKCSSANAAVTLSVMR